MPLRGHWYMTDPLLVIADGWDAAPAPQAQQQFAAGGDNFGAQY